MGTTQPSAPPAPGALTATAVSSSQINLTWTDNANTETSFKFERCQGESSNDFTQIATVGANVVAFANTGLDNGSEYTYGSALQCGR
jgi:hypothetical protein